MRDLLYVGGLASDPWRNRLHRFLQPLVRADLQIFDVNQITAGEETEKSNLAAIGRSKVAVLLVNAELLADDAFTLTVLEPLTQCYKRGETSLLWIPTGYCHYQLSALAELTPAWDPERPLESLALAEADGVVISVCEKMPGQQNLWVKSGSGRRPSVW